MTVQDLRKELIKINDKNEEYCSIYCKQLKLVGFDMDGKARYKCLINYEDLRSRIISSVLMSKRCQQCKNLF